MDNWMLISVALASNGMLMWPLVTGSMNAGALTASGAVQLINRESGDHRCAQTDGHSCNYTSAAPRTCLAQLEDKLPVRSKQSLPR
jgi:hypothetical protein